MKAHLSTISCLEARNTGRLRTDGFVNLTEEGVDVVLELCKGYPHFFLILSMLEMSAAYMEKWCVVGKVKAIRSFVSPADDDAKRPR